MATESNRHMIDSVTQIFDDRLKMMTAEFGKLTERMQAMDESLKEVKAFQVRQGAVCQFLCASLISMLIMRIARSHVLQNIYCLKHPSCEYFSNNWLSV